MRPTPQPDLVSGAVESTATPPKEMKEKMGQREERESSAPGSTPHLSHVILRRGPGGCGCFACLMPSRDALRIPPMIRVSHFATCVGTNRCTLE